MTTKFCTKCKQVNCFDGVSLCGGEVRTGQYFCMFCGASLHNAPVMPDDPAEYFKAYELLTAGKPYHGKTCSTEQLTLFLKR